MAQREKVITAGGLRQLRKELNHLSTIRRQEVADRIHRASGAGGTVDNAEYDQVKNEQAFIEGRIRDLENILSNAVVAANKRQRVGVVEIGSSVTVTTAEGRRRKYTLVGSVEAAPLQGKISNESPVGRALLGRKVGDEVDVEAPSGATKLTISEVS